MELYQIFEDSVDTDKFLEYLTSLRAANPDEKICIYMDNLRVHTSNRSKEAMREHGFRWVMAPPYSPEWNPIEFVFSQVKSNFRKLRAKKFMGLTAEPHEVLVSKSFDQIKKANVLKCIDHVFK